MLQDSAGYIYHSYIMDEKIQFSNRRMSLESILGLYISEVQGRYYYC